MESGIAIETSTNDDKDEEKGVGHIAHLTKNRPKLSGRKPPSRKR
jgi:hypothetical protein